MKIYLLNKYTNRTIGRNCKIWMNRLLRAIKEKTKAIAKRGRTTKRTAGFHAAKIGESDTSLLIDPNCRGVLSDFAHFRIPFYRTGKGFECNLRKEILCCGHFRCTYNAWCYKPATGKVTCDFSLDTIVYLSFIFC